MSEENRTELGQFKAGRSGNPYGRPKKPKFDVMLTLSKAGVNPIDNMIAELKKLTKQRDEMAPEDDAYYTLSKLIWEINKELLKYSASKIQARKADEDKKPGREVVDVDPLEDGGATASELTKILENTDS